MKRLAVIALLVACGPAPKPPAPTCRAQLAVPDAALPLPPPLRPSRIVAHAEISLATIKKELEAKVPVRLAEERGRDIGVAGSLNVTVDRGPLVVAVEGESLVVRTEVKAHAEACAKGRCYAGCDPGARATATVSLRLGADFRFPPSRVDAQLTERCFVRALFVRIDVTPILQGQLGPALRRIERDIDQRLPPLRPQAERLWAELGKTRPLPLGGCIVVAPSGLVQGPIEQRGDAMRMRFGVVAHPELRRACGDSPPAPALPALAHDVAMREKDDVLVGLVAPASSLSVMLPGDTCSDLSTSAGFAWSSDLADIRNGDARIDPPVPPGALKDLAPALASALSDPSVDVGATVDEVKPAEVFLREKDLVARVLVHGSVELRQR